MSSNLTVNWLLVALSALSGLFSALIIDLDAYKKAVKQNDMARYDIGLMFARAVKGLVTGALTGLGVSAGV